MAAQEEQANTGGVLGFLREWDRGSSAARSRLLDTFLARNAGKTSHELEVEFACVASLFLARLTTWMRVLFINGKFSGLLLKAIWIFLSASNDQYLLEFVQDGGVLTLLDIIGHSQCKEDHKAEAFHLLLTISDAGLKYKELICENHGVKVTADCLAISNADDTQQTAGALLESLSHGNPKYQDQIYQSLIPLMTCLTPKSQQLVLHTIHNVQLKLKTAHHNIVAPLLNMLRSQHLEVQDEAINLILDLKLYDVKAMLLSGLVPLLRPIKEEVQQDQLNEVEAETIKGTRSLPAFVQQAAAAKTIRLLAEADQELSHELLYLGVIQHLLYAMGNREHADAQIQASLALRHFVQSFPGIGKHVQKVMGSMLFAAFTNKAETIHINMNKRQAEILQSNKVSMSQALDDNTSDC